MNQIPLLRIVKSVLTKHHNISLYETFVGDFWVKCESLAVDDVQDPYNSGPIKDYSTASFLFDSKMREFQSH